MSGERRVVKGDGIEFRYYGDELDEIVASNVDIHFECMGTGSWWMSIHTQGEQRYMVNLGSKPIGVPDDDAADWNDKNLTNWAFHEEDRPHDLLSPAADQRGTRFSPQRHSHDTAPIPRRAVLCRAAGPSNP